MPTTAAPTPPRSLPVVLAILAVLLGAGGWFWPVLDHGLRSDDFLIVYYQDRLSGAVHWGRVLEEFVRPWFGTVDLWRPLVSVSFGIDGALWPQPAARHAGNVLLLGVTAGATAAAAGSLAVAHRGLAALLAGLVVVLHPAAVEPTAWICGRTTGLQMAFVALTAWLFVRHLVGNGPRWPALSTAALALGCKEGAVMLPFVLLGIDLLHAPRRALGARCRLHAPFVALVGAYFGWRWWLLGQLGAAEANGSLLDSVGNTAIRTLQLLAAPNGDGQVPWFVWLGLPALLLALSPWVYHLRARAALLPLWLVGLLAPTHQMVATHGTMFGRLLFDAVPAFGLLLGVAAAGGVASTPRWLRWLAPAALLLWLAPAAATSQQWLQRFDRDDADARAVERALATTAAQFTPDRPLAITGLPYLPLYHSRLWGVLGLRPFAASDLPVLGLPELIKADHEWPQFFNDAAPMHAVRAAGGALATLVADPLRFQPLAGPSTPSAELVAGTAAGEFVVATPWPGSAVQRVVVTPRQPAQQVRLRLLDDFPDERGLGWLTQATTNDTVEFDLTHATAPALLQSVGVPFRGVQIEVDGAPAAADTRVVVHDSLPGPPADDTAANTTRSLGEMQALSQHPPQPMPLRLYMLLPTGARHMDVPDVGSPMSAALHEHLRYALRIYEPVMAYWFWQTPPNAAAPWRSRLQHAVVHGDVR